MFEVKRPYSYLICSTPRTGSTLLCGLLQSTGVAGNPESYFREPDKKYWANRWGLSTVPQVDDSEFVKAAVSAGTTANGVFGCRIMWGSMDDVIEKLHFASLEAGEDTLSLLNSVFGPTRFVYLRRDNVVAQAVSWLRAEQTNIWHSTDAPGPDRRPNAAQFDHDEIENFVRTIKAHNLAWEHWFKSTGAEIYPVLYEDLVADLIGTTNTLLDYLQIELPTGQEIAVRNKRVSDELNSEWIKRYQK